MPEPKTKLTVELPPHEAQALRTLADDHDLSVAQVVRRAVRRVLAEHGEVTVTSTTLSPLEAERV